MSEELKKEAAEEAVNNEVAVNEEVKNEKESQENDNTKISREEFSELSKRVRKIVQDADNVNSVEEAEKFIADVDNQIKELIKKQSDLQADEITAINGMSFTISINVKNLKKLMDYLYKNMTWTYKDIYKKLGSFNKLESLYVSARTVASKPENLKKEEVEVKIAPTDAQMIANLITSDISGKGYTDAKMFVKAAADVVSSFKPVFEGVQQVDNNELTKVNIEVSAMSEALYDAIVPKFKAKGFFNFTNEAIDKVAKMNNKTIK